jgi:hypothetical protein
MTKPMTRQDAEAKAPLRVVAVVDSKKYSSYRYYAAVIYELRPRNDGALTYRRTADCGIKRRSEQLALTDGEQLAAEQDIPLWPFVRHNMAALTALTVLENRNAAAAT